MRKFISTLVLFSSPFLLVIILYFSFDPFRVVRNYDSYFPAEEVGEVSMDKDYISTTNFCNRYIKEKYDSFVFGNSRSIFYEVDEWKKYIGENCKCYHFDGADEALYSMHKKFLFLDDKVKLKNVLLILDYSTLRQDKPKEGHLGIISPVLVNNSNYIEFHKTFIEAFFNIRYLYTYLDYKISKKVKPYMLRDGLIGLNNFKYDPITNEIRFEYFENLINTDEKKYYDSNKMKDFYQRDSIQQYSVKFIHGSQEKMLKDISEILNKHNANYKVIINPLYDQLKLNQSDLCFLQKLFGVKNVYDYSGINSITNNYKNYYEGSHYRSHVADSIMKEIYN